MQHVTTPEKIYRRVDIPVVCVSYVRSVLKSGMSFTLVNLLDRDTSISITSVACFSPVNVVVRLCGIAVLFFAYLARMQYTISSICGCNGSSLRASSLQSAAII